MRRWRKFAAETLERGSAFLRPLLLAATSIVLISAVMPPVAHPDGVTRVELDGVDRVGTFGGVAFQRYHGVLHGVVARTERVAGLHAVLAGRNSLPYDAAFELIAPVSPQSASTVLVEVENRGRPAFLASLAGFRTPDTAAPDKVIYPADFGNGFPFRAGIAYGRVAWQVGVTSAVPENAQGVGEVILRQFGQLLSAEGHLQSDGSLPRFAHRVLAGTSQSAWMVNAFIWEGFNRDGTTGAPVYQSAFTRDGVGNVLAINRAAYGGGQTPYLRPNAVPLTPAELLHQPRSDPILVDIAAYTDFYRLRASIFMQSPRVARLHRYAVAAAHAPAGAVPNAVVFGTLRCNAGEVVPLSALDDASQNRALLTALIGEAGAPGVKPATLPAERKFVLVAPSGALINRLPGYALRIPAVDAAALPIGGVPMMETALPLGRPVPPAISPISTRSITDVCGNFGGWQAYTPGQLAARYGSLQRYLSLAAKIRRRQQKGGFLLPVDVAAERVRIERLAGAAFDASADLSREKSL